MRGARPRQLTNFPPGLITKTNCSEIRSARVPWRPLEKLVDNFSPSETVCAPLRAAVSPLTRLVTLCAPRPFGSFYELNLAYSGKKVFTHRRRIDTSMCSPLFEGKRTSESRGNRENSFIDFAAEVGSASQQPAKCERGSRAVVELFSVTRTVSFILFVLKSLSLSPTHARLFPLHALHFGTTSTAPRRSLKSCVCRENDAISGENRLKLILSVASTR